MRLTVLDAFRGIFALIIVLVHANYQSHLFPLSFVRHGGLFVQFFFVLSGFVVTMAYWDKTTDLKSLAGFLVRRIGRLWPLHAFLLALFVGLLLAKTAAAYLGIYTADPAYTGPEISAFILEHLFLVQSFRNETVYWLNFPAWSISAELIAYVVFGVLCVTGRYVMVSIAVLAATWLAALGVVDFGFGHFFENGLFAATAYFLIGHFCFRIWRSGKKSLPRPAFLEVAIVLLIVLETIYADRQYMQLVTPLSFAAAVFIFAHEAGPVSRFLKTAPFVALGALSYSIYMTHALVYEVMSLVVSAAEKKLGWSLFSPNAANPTERLIDFGSPFVMDAVVLALVAAVVYLSTLTYRYIEMPGQDFSKALAKRIEARLLNAQDLAA